MLEERRRRLRARLGELSLDGLILLSSENVRYLSGFTGSEGTVIITGDGGYFLTDSRYTTQAGQEVPGFEIITFKKKLDGLKDVMAQAGIGRLGFEASVVSFGMYQDIAAAVPEVELVPLKKELDEIRMVKDGEEVELIRKAVAIGAEGFHKLLDKLKPGAVEREVASELEYSMRQGGGERLSFDVIIASGWRSALPHGIASDKRIERGELVVVDFGTSYKGYYGDETQTVVVGPANDKHKEIFEIVVEAHARAISAVRPGVSLKEIDAAARSFIAEAGYGDYFGHGTGHGIGLAVHEPPRVAPGSEVVAQPGMVFSIEPGIYLPGWGGVRLEDLVVVTEDGCRVLSPIPKELKIL